MMNVRFWGVRGSIATAGAPTHLVGGNTACVEVRAGDTLIVLDAGTGIRALGQELVRGGGAVDVGLLVTHFHWDHIQGFPFFVPAFVPGNRVAVHGAAEGGVRAALEAQMRPPHFPVGLDALRARVEYVDVTPGARFRVGAVEIRSAATRHPDGCLAYRLEHEGASLVYATDTEHDPAGAIDGRLLDLARDADVLVYDAQYTADEMAGGGKRGWGHSTALEGVRVARAAGAGRLVLFHHDPAREDWAVAAIEAEARLHLPATVAAREGLTLRIEGRDRAREAA